jgi:hypothetical protein
VSSELGVSDEKILALDEYATSPLYEEKERAALEYADRMTITDQDVDDELFSRLRWFFDEDALWWSSPLPLPGRTHRASSTGPCACRPRVCGNAHGDASVIYVGRPHIYHGRQAVYYRLSGAGNPLLGFFDELA